ncbi:hypothetical protein CV016_05375 [Yersinia kristensenii]|uniref:Uncharacterized protein n=1 Tax=Yersinia kristensenii TaxID=28152 RepID=A0AB73NKJ6_YERKR|nr:hypothetical protein CBW52_09910 [Yersinia kristensenii]PJG63656.1 hypothetical protein CV016_05375 [Yersinia kristensenii]
MKFKSTFELPSDECSKGNPPWTADLGVTRSGQAIRALAQGFQGGYALVTPLAIETQEVR